MITTVCIRANHAKLLATATRRYFTTSPLLNRQLFRPKLADVPNRSLPCCSLIHISVTDFLNSRYASTGWKLPESNPEKDPSKSQLLNLRSLTTFHPYDKLDPKEWILIYHNQEYERTKNFIPPMIIFGVVSILVLTFTMILVLPDLPLFKYQSHDWLFLGWPIGIAFLILLLTKFRRLFVLRIYQNRASAGAKSGKRRYCIIWLDMLLRRKKFIYDHIEASEAIERHQAIANFVGNFKVRRRPWHVKATYFERPQDYFNVRLPLDSAS